MAKVQEKQEALRLRRKGFSIKEIAKKLKVSKGSVSLWCQDIELNANQKELLKQKQTAAGSVGRSLGAEMNRQKRLTAIQYHKENGVTEVGQLSKRDLFLLGIGLYWGEGVKSRNGMAALVNSDVELITLGKKWFEECLGVSKEDFRPYVYVSAHHASRQEKIIQFWSNELSLPVKSFNVILLKDRPKKVYENHEAYFGVMHLRVKSSTDLKYRIQGLIDACK
jgi:transcriptional regulator with XRE-family HTH domain